MGESPSQENKDQSEAPAPEELKPREEASSEPAESTATGAPPAGGDAAKAPVPPRPLRRTTYRPSHRATFVGLAVVVVILAVNAAVIMFVLKSQSKSAEKAANGDVTISQDVLDKLGVNRTAVDDLGVELTIGPATRFNKGLQVGGDVSVAGQLKLNSKFSATDASLTNLQAGNTSLNQLNVNGDGTVSNLNLRRDLTVTGTARMQGSVTVAQMLTSNNMSVTGNLAVGGVLSARTFQASNLSSDSTLTIGGHIITRGSAPGVSGGTALGSNGTVSISGNDAAGTVAVNIGAGAVSGILANVSFRSSYGNTPKVVVTAVGRGLGALYVSRNSGGFSIGTNSAVAPGGYAIDYIVMQ